MSTFSEVLSGQQAQAQEPRNQEDQRLKVQQFLMSQDQARQAAAMQNQQMQHNSMVMQEEQQQKQTQQTGMTAYLNAVKARQGGQAATGGTTNGYPDVSATGGTKTPDMPSLDFDTVSRSILKQNPNINPQSFAAAMKQFEPQFQQQDKMKLAQFNAQMRQQTKGPGNVEEQIYATALKQGKSPEEAAAMAQTYKRAGVDEKTGAAAGVNTAKELVKFGSTINQQADSAVAANKSLSRIQTLMKDFDPGKMAPLKSQLSQWAQSLGVMSQEEADSTFGSAGSMGAIGKIAIGLAANQTKALTSRPALLEFQSFMKANPNVEMTPDMLNKVMTYSADVNNLALEKQKEFQKWKKENPYGDSVDFDSMWNQKVTNEFMDKDSEVSKTLIDMAGKNTGNGAPQTRGATQAPIPNAKQAPDGNWYVPDPNRPGKYLQVQ